MRSVISPTKARDAALKEAADAILGEVSILASEIPQTQGQDQTIAHQSAMATVLGAAFAKFLAAQFWDAPGALEEAIQLAQRNLEHQTRRYALEVVIGRTAEGLTNKEPRK